MTQSKKIVGFTSIRIKTNLFIVKQIFKDKHLQLGHQNRKIEDICTSNSACVSEYSLF